MMGGQQISHADHCGKLNDSDAGSGRCLCSKVLLLALVDDLVM